MITQFIFRFEIGDAYLGAVSRFMTNAFEYGDALLPRAEGEDSDEASTPNIGNNQPYLNVATYVISILVCLQSECPHSFRMVVLADEILESFFETDLSASFRLEHLEMAIPTSNSGFLGGLIQSIVTDDNKRFFNRFTDEIGKTIGKHQVLSSHSFTRGRSHIKFFQVLHRPSIGRQMQLQEPKARESLLTPSMRRSSSKSSLATTETVNTEKSGSASSVTPSTTASSLEVPDKTLPPTPSMPSPLPHVSFANAALMERTAFAIDTAKDEDEEEEDAMFGIGGDDDDQLMDEVCSSFSCGFFLC